MSVSKWAWRQACDGDYCPGDCDKCPKAEEEDEPFNWNFKRFVTPKPQPPKCEECGEQCEPDIGYNFAFYHLNDKCVCECCFLDYFGDYKREEGKCDVCGKTKECIVSDTDDKYYITGYELICEDCLLKRNEV